MLKLRVFVPQSSLRQVWKEAITPRCDHQVHKIRIWVSSPPSIQSVQTFVVIMYYDPSRARNVHAQLTVVDYTNPIDVSRSAIKGEDCSALIDQSNAGL